MTNAAVVLGCAGDLAPSFDTAFSIFVRRRLKRLPVSHPVQVGNEIVSGTVGGQIKIAVSEAIVRRIRMTSIDFYKLLVELRREFSNSAVVKRTYALSRFLI